MKERKWVDYLKLKFDVAIQDWTGTWAGSFLKKFEELLLVQNCDAKLQFQVSRPLSLASRTNYFNYFDNDNLTRSFELYVPSLAGY